MTWNLYVRCDLMTLADHVFQLYPSQRLVRKLSNTTTSELFQYFEIKMHISEFVHLLVEIFSKIW